jgi:hypothetical protein
LEIRTISDAVLLIHRASRSVTEESRPYFDDVIEKLIDRRLNPAELERAWDEFMSLIIIDPL